MLWWRWIPGTVYEVLRWVRRVDSDSERILTFRCSSSFATADGQSCREDYYRSDGDDGLVSTVSPPPRSRTLLIFVQQSKSSPRSGWLVYGWCLHLCSSVGESASSWPSRTPARCIRISVRQTFVPSTYFADPNDCRTQRSAGQSQSQMSQMKGAASFMGSMKLYVSFYMLFRVVVLTSRVAVEAIDGAVSANEPQPVPLFLHLAARHSRLDNRIHLQLPLNSTPRNASRRIINRGADQIPTYRSSTTEVLRCGQDYEKYPPFRGRRRRRWNGYG